MKDQDQRDVTLSGAPGSLAMPQAVPGVRVGRFSLPLEARELPEAGTTGSGRLVVVGVTSPRAVVFALRHAWISADLGLFMGSSLSGSVLLEGGCAYVSVHLSYTHALLFGGSLIFPLVALLFGSGWVVSLLLCGWVAWQLRTLKRAAEAVARDAVWAMDLLTSGRSPWKDAGSA